MKLRCLLGLHTWRTLESVAFGTVATGDRIAYCIHCWKDRNR